MSLSGKRDAAVAFDGSAEQSPHALKRQRHRKRTSLNPKDGDTPVPLPERTTQYHKTSQISQGSNSMQKDAGKAKSILPSSPTSIEPTPASNKPGKLTADQREKALSEKLEKQRAALQVVKQERQEKNKAYRAKKNKQSTPSKAHDKQVDEHVEAKSADNATSKRVRKTSKPAITNSIPSEQRVDGTSQKLQELPLQTKEDRSEDAMQIVHTRPGEKKKKSRATEVSATKPEEQLVVKRSRDKKKTSKTTNKPITKKDTAESGWKTSPIGGGMFIDQDPLLTDDGQHLILPTHSEVQIYSTKTSLLVRSLNVGSKSDLTSCALSISDRNRLYVANSKGRLSISDWVTGGTKSTIAIGKGVRQVLPLYSHGETETVLFLQDEGYGDRSIVAHHVNVSAGRSLNATTLLERPNLSPCIRSLAQGSVLVACANNKLILGHSQISSDGQSELAYTWREVTVPGHITSFDAQINSSKSKTSRQVPSLEVVVGLNDGVILHYEDILFKLIGKEKKNQKGSEEITARKLHWHRTAVNTVKWSRDRNYIISGGNETVLVIWQLDSNQRQYLPHLSTPILNLTVSAAGSSYALRLADNSVMILSTADLLPSTNITGLALGWAQQTSPTILFHPQTPHRLLAAIPSDATHNKPPTFLQIYDIDSSIQLTRQALTRNTITATNVAPTGQSVKEPRVTHMKISHDGKWLATVDEWTPNKQDIEAMYVTSDDKTLQGKATETSLRLWLWNDSSNSFEQVTRIDEPHRPGSNSVFDMSFSPSKLELATIGADASIRIWTPKARHRNGVTVRNSADEQLYTWTGSRTVDCSHDASNNQAASSATIAYAEDGSVLAASWSFPASLEPSALRPRFTHLIDPSTGAMVLSIPSLLTRGPARLLFHTRYLLALSSTLTILDTITLEQIPSPLKLDENFIPPNSSAPLFLARNKFDGTFAVGVGKSERPRAGKVFIFSLENNPVVDGEESGVQVKIVYQETFTRMLKGVLALTTGPGYVLIDERNQTRMLRRSGTAALPIANGAKRVETEEVTRSLDSIFGRQSRGSVQGDAPAIGSAPMRGLLTAPETDGYAADGGLSAVLNFVNSATAPSPTELFQRVVGVLARG
ncbi:NET1-associated nuclear protein 1 [Cladophialophora chaetospira]|uniref:NET1-associated nuclear protein 1 n=1 Tax=Cladophialophora chaetospira TaxID=386627 RepID=A0AA39CQQ1_9EURO|nr:NET1-associated nuclear protein 1 [Cladophialophora chaetospira]